MSDTICFADLSYLLDPIVFMQTLELMRMELRLGFGYDSLHITRRIEFPWVLNELNPQREDIILDAGCGKTVIGMHLATKVKKIVGVDLDLESISFLSNQAGKLKKKPIGEYSAEIGDILKLNYKNEYFDKVYCISTLEHLDRTEIYPAINELLRVTKHGGKVVLTMDASQGQSNFMIPDIDTLALRYNLNWASSKAKPMFNVEDNNFTVVLIRIDKL